MNPGQLEVLGTSAEQAFQRWQADNPEGCYLNRKTKTAAMLHRVGCSHVGGANEWDPAMGDVTRNAKICSRDEADLLAWAEREGVTYTRCADCQK